jgi:hypothetical protein
VNNTQLKNLDLNVAHAYFRDRIIDDVTLIGENHSQLELILAEIYYRKPTGKEFFPMCDFVMRFSYGYVCCELKHVGGHRNKALTQLDHGRMYVQSEYGRMIEPALKIAYYDEKTFEIHTETIWEPRQN